MTDSLYQVVVLHVKVKDNAICKHIGKVGHEAEGGKMIQGTEIGKKRQRNQQCEQVYSTMRVGGERKGEFDVIRLIQARN